MSKVKEGRTRVRDEEKKEKLFEWQCCVVCESVMLRGERNRV